MEPFLNERKKYCSACGEELTETNRYPHTTQLLCTPCGRADHVRRQMEYQSRLRERAMKSLGDRCVICGEAEDLQIDHVHGDGKQERAQGRLRTSLYRAVLDPNNKGKYQPLCATCNRNKGNMTTNQYIDYILRTADYIRQNRQHVDDN
jgi:hypothetical protein